MLWTCKDQWWGEKILPKPRAGVEVVSLGVKKANVVLRKTSDGKRDGHGGRDEGQGNQARRCGAEKHQRSRGKLPPSHGRRRKLGKEPLQEEGGGGFIGAMGCSPHAWLQTPVHCWPDPQCGDIEELWRAGEAASDGQGWWPAGTGRGEAGGIHQAGCYLLVHFFLSANPTQGSDKTQRQG